MQEDETHMVSLLIIFTNNILYQYGLVLVEALHPSFSISCGISGRLWRSSVELTKGLIGRVHLLHYYFLFSCEQ